MGKEDNNSLQFKSQDFSIGLTMLSIGLLVDNCDCYDLKKKLFNHDLLNKRLYEFIHNTNIYSDVLKCVIYGLCAVKTEERLTSK